MAIVQSADPQDPVAGFTVRLIGALRHEGVDAVVVPMSGGEIFPAVSGPFRRLRRLRHWHRAMRRIFAEQGPFAAVFTHMSPTASLLVWPYARFHSIPIITWFGHARRHPLLFLVERVSSCIVSASPGSYPNPSARFQAIGQGIDIDLFSPLPARTVSPPLILLVGRLTPIKRHEILIDALAALSRRGIPFSAAFVGNGTNAGDRAYAARLAALVRDHGIDPHVSFVRGVPQEDLPQWYRRATVSVNVTPAGSFDKTVLEAWASGTPSLVLNPLFAPFMGPYAGMLSIRDFSALHLADMLSAVISLPDPERAAMSRYLRDQVISHHSLPAFARKLSAIFRSL